MPINLEQLLNAEEEGAKIELDIETTAMRAGADFINSKRKNISEFNQAEINAYIKAILDKASEDYAKRIGIKPDQNSNSFYKNPIVKNLIFDNTGVARSKVAEELAKDPTNVTQVIRSQLGEPLMPRLTELRLGEITDNDVTPLGDELIAEFGERGRRLNRNKITNVNDIRKLYQIYSMYNRQHNALTGMLGEYSN